MDSVRFADDATFADKMLVGQIIKDVLDADQAEFDKSNPKLNNIEKLVSDGAKELASAEFNKLVEEKKTKIQKSLREWR